MARNSSATAEKTTSRQLAETAARMEALRAKGRVEDAEAELGRRRLEEARGRFEQLGESVRESREKEHADRQAARRQTEETFARLQRFVDEAPPVRIGYTEASRQFAQLDRFVTQVNDQERKELTDQAEADRQRCLGDLGYRESYARRHPGGADKCDCRAHRAARNEEY